ncbi:shikimate dehydrogenase [Oleidesulfovibrio alaskensis]|jgi:shikimate dehydrogenase|uniref:shikimate dehydrogenase n=1 Tax=Oleidesulfovibrio alaskensis TaxID=58180 RepID=UPI001A4762DF|nr:shikimate dehydrogenase [Oleidesulfovibrio alaskensis]MBL3580978.1 shikimate dehydrogenase [Oleidesulfovibrio alaskensis]
MTTPRIPRQLYGIIGYPLGHSMSPLLHNWGFELLGEQAAYMAFPVAPEKLAEFICCARMLPVSGLSVTIPHKQAVMPLLDAVTPRAQAAGAVNTLFYDDGKLTGDNTDVYGFLHPLDSCGTAHAAALVLGAGGAANAVLAALTARGMCNVTVTNRNGDRARILAERFGVRCVAWEERHAVDADLVVNTTPLGMAGDRQAQTPLDPAFFSSRPAGLAYDLIYNPAQTFFLASAQAAGWRVLNGLDMFVAQGAEQFRIWRGRELPFVQARALIADALASGC